MGWAGSAAAPLSARHQNLENESSRSESFIHVCERWFLAAFTRSRRPGSAHSSQRPTVPGPEEPSPGTLTSPEELDAFTVKQEVKLTVKHPDFLCFLQNPFPR